MKSQFNKLGILVTIVTLSMTLSSCEFFKGGADEDTAGLVANVINSITIDGTISLSGVSAATSSSSIINGVRQLAVTADVTDIFLIGFPKDNSKPPSAKVKVTAGKMTATKLEGFKGISFGAFVLTSDGGVYPLISTTPLGATADIAAVIDFSLSSLLGNIAVSLKKSDDGELVTVSNEDLLDLTVLDEGKVYDMEILKESYLNIETSTELAQEGHDDRDNDHGPNPGDKFEIFMKRFAGVTVDGTSYDKLVLSENNGWVSKCDFNPDKGEFIYTAWNGNTAIEPVTIDLSSLESFKASIENVFELLPDALKEQLLEAAKAATADRDSVCGEYEKKGEDNPINENSCFLATEVHTDGGIRQGPPQLKDLTKVTEITDFMKFTTPEGTIMYKPAVSVTEYYDSEEGGFVGNSAVGDPTNVRKFEYKEQVILACQDPYRDGMMTRFIDLLTQEEALEMTLAKAIELFTSFEEGNNPIEHCRVDKKLEEKKRIAMEMLERIMERFSDVQEGDEESITRQLRHCDNKFSSKRIEETKQFCKNMIANFQSEGPRNKNGLVGDAPKSHEDRQEEFKPEGFHEDDYEAFDPNERFDPATGEPIPPPGGEPSLNGPEDPAPPPAILAQEGPQIEYDAAIIELAKAEGCTDEVSKKIIKRFEQDPFESVMCDKALQQDLIQGIFALKENSCWFRNVRMEHVCEAQSFDDISKLGIIPLSQQAGNQPDYGNRGGEICKQVLKADNASIAEAHEVLDRAEGVPAPEAKYDSMRLEKFTEHDPVSGSKVDREVSFGVSLTFKEVNPENPKVLSETGSVKGLLEFNDNRRKAKSATGDSDGALASEKTEDVYSAMSFTADPL